MFNGRGRQKDWLRPGGAQAERTIRRRQRGRKAVLLGHLRKYPVLEPAIRRTGIDRSTYYRWRQQDPDFAAEVDEAIGEGRSMVSDKAESNVIQKIQDGDMSASKYFLEKHHPDYKRRREGEAPPQNFTLIMDE